MTSSPRPGKKSNSSNSARSSRRSKTSSSRADGSSQNATSEADSQDTPGSPAVYASDVIAMVKREEADKRKTSGSQTGDRSSAVMSLPNQVDDLPIESLGLPEIPDNVPMQDRPGLVLRMAEEAFAKTGSWVVFYRELLAPGGVVDQLYDTPEARRYFEKTPHFADLLEMVTAIRSQDDSKAGTYEPERVITVRLPRSLHAAAVREAEELELTVNSFCLTKILQPAGARFTPVQSGVRRGRRPGPQISYDRVKVRVDQHEDGGKSGRKRKSKTTNRK